MGRVSTTIDVSDAAPALQTQTTDVGTLIEPSVIANLPLETRNPQKLALRVPGAVTIDPPSFNRGQKNVQPARRSLNGNREQANYYLTGRRRKHGVP
jgi:hypothetical protein